MAGLIELMRSANFNCETTAELLTQAEQAGQAEQGEANDRLGMTPLLRAAMLGLLSAVKGPLAAGVDANIRYGVDELSLLDAATLMGHPEVVRALLEHGVDVNNTSPDRYTALHCAVHLGRADLLLDVIDLLLSAGADIDAPTDQGFTPLQLAASRRDCDDLTAILLRYGANKNGVDNLVHRSPLHMAAQYGNVAATRALLDAGAEVTVCIIGQGPGTKTPLDTAAKFGQVEVIREFARHGVDLDYHCEETHRTALDHAARKNHAGAVDALIELGASVTSRALDSATYPLAVEAMATLLQHGAPIRAAVVSGCYPSKKNPPLHIAARLGGTEGAAEAVELLLKWGADDSERCYHGNIPSEMVGVDYGRNVADDVVPPPRLVADADRVRELLAKAQAWRRRKLLLLCLARNRTATRKRKMIGDGGNGEGKGKGKGRGVEEGALARAGGSGGGGDCAVPSHADVGPSAAVVGKGERETTPSKVSGGGGGGGSGCSGSGSGGGLENRVDFDGVVATLVGFEEEGFFRTIVGFL